MASIIKSDNGVSSGVTGIVQIADSSGQLSLQTTTSSGTATTAVTVDNAQNVGVGVTPSAWGGTYKALDISTYTSVYGANGNTSGFSQNAYYNGTNWIYRNTNAASNYIQSGGTHVWQTASSGTAGNAITFTQAMTLDASSNLLVGATANVAESTRLYVLADGTHGAAEFNVPSTVSYTQIFFRNPNGVVGSILTAASATSYVTSSDYRLKNTIEPMTGALNKVALLKPVTYKWNVDNSDGEGFIAHELAEVCPQAVTGEKDAVDEDGNPKYQGIDTSFLVATLTAAIQELSAQVTTLQTQVTALQAKG